MRLLLRALVPALAASAAAQSLPVRHFDVPEGLAHSRVLQVALDSRGYLWCATWEGLSRFDGKRFVNYGVGEGLGVQLINVVAEDRSGRIWVGTQVGGVARLIEDARDPRRGTFRTFDVPGPRRADDVTALAFDSAGRMWCGTGEGLFRVSELESGELEFAPVLPGISLELRQQMLLDSRDRLWLAAGGELLHVSDGGVDRFALPQEASSEPLKVLCEAPGGRVFAAQDHAVFQFEPPGTIDGEARWTRMPIELAAEQYVRALFVDSRERLWTGTSEGLVRLANGRAELFTVEQGLPDDAIRTLVEDRDGGLWIGTWSGGLCRIAGEEIVSWKSSPRFPGANVTRLVQTPTGSILACTDHGGVFRVLERGVEPLPNSGDPTFREASSRYLLDHRGDWWIGTAAGLHRAPGPELDLARAVALEPATAFPAPGVFGQIFEDRAGRIWLGGLDFKLYCWDPERSAEPRFESLPWASGAVDAPRAFLEDSGGTLWIASYTQLARLRDGRLSFEEPRPGLPDVQARALLEDRRGRVWIGLRFHGVSFTDEPGSERPRFENLSTRDGLSSDAVWAIAEDDAGRVYFGTGRGVDRYDPESGRIRTIDVSAGLAGRIVNHLLRDRDGFIWAATSTGVSRIDPRVERAPHGPPATVLARVQVAGEDRPLPERGAAELELGELDREQSNLRIEYSAVDLGDANALRFQTRLTGMETDWSAPVSDSSVRYAHLAPGGYRLEVRAFDLATQRAGAPAVLSFAVLRPLWQRPWFLALAALLAGSIAFGLHRLRLRQALALERIRSQIALDLHDDLGANLSQIAILSEVARRDAAPASGSKLAQVAELARSMRESLGDIVWSVDPRKDRALDLVQRMRQAGFAFAESDGVALEFRAPRDEELAGLALAPDKRRHVLLIFKEALHNVIRHAGAARVEAELALDGAALALSVSDDGRGFDPAQAAAGHGLHSMRSRAVALGGELELRSSPGAGTSVRLRVPL